MTAVAYAPLWNAGFIWDDDSYIVDNAALRSSHGLLRIWLDTSTVRQYYPLVYTTFWIEYRLWGLAPLGYHLVNVLLHAASAVLLWQLLARLRVPGAWLAAAIFAVHPVMVESVAWVTERKNTLSLALALVAMHAYLRFSPIDEAGETLGARRAKAGQDAPSLYSLPPGEREYGTRTEFWAWYALALVAFAGALLSKTVVASLPTVMLVIYWWKRGQIGRRDVLPLVPFFVLGIASGLLTVQLERVNVGAVGEEWNFTALERMLIAGRAVWFYAAKLAWPHPLAFFYPRFDIDARVWWQYLFPLAAVALPVGLWLARRKIGRGPLAAALIFGGVLLPALGFYNVYPFRYSLVADHFQYHASLALIVLAAAGAALAAARLPDRWRMPSRIASAAVLAALAGLTARQARVYENLETLYHDTIAKNPTGPTAYENLGVYFESQRRYDEARELFAKALELHSNEMAHSNMGHILLKLGQRDGFEPAALETIEDHFRQALEIDPDSFAAGRGLALALLYAHRYDEAVEQFARALQKHPGNAQAHIELGDLLAKQRNFAAAAEQFRLAVDLAPANLDAWNNLGILSGELGKLDDAIACFEEVLRQQPNSAQAKANLNVALKLKANRAAAR